MTKSLPISEVVEGRVDPTKRITPSSRPRKRLYADDHPLTKSEKEKLLKAIRYGFTLKAAAELIGLRVVQLQKLLHDDLEFYAALVQGRRGADLELAQTAFEIALAGDSRMLAHLLRLRLGWHDEQIPTPATESDGTPVQVIDDKMTEKEAANVFAKMRKTAAVTPDLRLIKLEDEK